MFSTVQYFPRLDARCSPKSLYVSDLYNFVQYVYTLIIVTLLPAYRIHLVSLRACTSLLEHELCIVVFICLFVFLLLYFI